MVTQAQRSRGIRLAAIAISCTALVGAAIGPALASSRSAATSATHSGADIVRIQHLEAETAGADSGDHQGADTGDGADTTPEADPSATDGGDAGGD